MKDIFTDLYKKLAGFFHPVEEKEDGSKKEACNRLKFVLMQDRTNLNPYLLERMRSEMVDVLSKYVEMDREALELSFEQEGESMALMLSIPVIRAKEEDEIQAIIKAEEEAKAVLAAKEAEQAEEETSEDVDESEESEENTEEAVTETVDAEGETEDEDTCVCACDDDDDDYGNDEDEDEEEDENSTCSCDEVIEKKPTKAKKSKTKLKKFE